jgi:hypothetical protein
MNIEFSFCLHNYLHHKVNSKEKNKKLAVFRSVFQTKFVSAVSADSIHNSALAVSGKNSSKLKKCVVRARK